MIYPHSQIWTPETIRDIHTRAQGDYMLSGFKPFREIPTFDELVFLAAGLTRFPLEGYKEKCKTVTTLGTKHSSKPLITETPVLVASKAGLKKEARIALARGSALVHSAISVGGRLFPEERKGAERLIYELPAEATDSKFVAPIKADAIQINISKMISADRLAGLIKKIRAGQEYKVPIFVSFSVGKVRDEVKAIVRSGADGLVLNCLDTTVVHEPEGVLNYNRMPVVAAIPSAREALRENKALGEVNLIAATGIRNGADAAKALALGADAVVINEGALIALGYYGRTEELKNKDPEKGAEYVAKFINSITMEIALLARSLGKGDVHSLEYEDLAALTIEASMMTGVRLAGE
jgi:NAD(P)H-dependent flavin oxidoreductase YrpB (nitropropane dioxygenase family)